MSAADGFRILPTSLSYHDDPLAAPHARLATPCTATTSTAAAAHAGTATTTTTPGTSTSTFEKS